MRLQHHPKARYTLSESSYRSQEMLLRKMGFSKSRNTTFSKLKDSTDVPYQKVDFFSPEGQKRKFDTTSVL